MKCYYFTNDALTVRQHFKAVASSSLYNNVTNFMKKGFSVIGFIFKVYIHIFTTIAAINLMGYNLSIF